MDLESCICKMVKNMKGSLLKVRNMEKEFICGKMVIDMKDSLLMTKGRVWESIIGVMEDFIRVNGRQIE